MNAGSAVVEARSRQREALAKLFDAHFDDVYRFCLARSGDPATADDVAQEAFAAAARAYATGRGDEVSRPWLFLTARRRLYDHWRSARRHDRRVQQLARVRQDDPHEADDANVAALTDRVLAVLGSLPERQRAAIALRYLDEFSVSEVAAALEVQYQAAESLLARGRRAFTRAWEEAQ